ncbi:MAG: cobalamin-dependent protein, partial [Anaerolineae bacterium]
MTDVLYIHPARHAVDAGYQDLGFYFLIPVGVIGLANLLRHQGYTVRGINYPAELLRDRSFKLKPWLKEQQGVRLVMVDLHWFEHAFGAISVARACREVLPDARVVLGGFTASVYASEILQSFPEVDFIIRGDAELPLARLVAELGCP